MAQSLSEGSGNPSRMTLTVIFSRRESSNMREIIACRELAESNTLQRKFKIHTREMATHSAALSSDPALRRVAPEATKPGTR